MMPSEVESAQRGELPARMMVTVPSEPRLFRRLETRREVTGGGYRSLLATPHVPALFGWALLARLPLGMAVLGIVLLVRGSGGSYAAAGVVTACYAIALGGGAPVAGRLVDRGGARRVLLPRALLCPLALLA